MILPTLALTGIFAVSFIPSSIAANTGCISSGSIANCPDVPTDGISYSTGVATININGDQTPTIVSTGVVGVSLTRSGIHAAEVDGEIIPVYGTIDIDDDNDEDTPDIQVLALNGQPVLASDNSYIKKIGSNPDIFQVGTNAYEPEALAELLMGIEQPSGGGVSGSLTINNVNQAGNFSTTNAHGIQIESLGGRGGNGTCTTILLATWCRSGKTGGNAGSVVINSDTAITVNGTAAAYGVSAVSIGGDGGKGGGSGGAFYSGAGSGGNGGDGGDVLVSLGSNSSINTHGNEGHGVYAFSHGGDGGRGGSADAAVASGSKGGNGGDAGQVIVSNHGSIVTSGQKAYGIFAQSVGAGAGKGSSSGGIVAIGGNGGGESSGNIVTVTNTGTIETKGVDSFGILAQSIGGGGGDGGGAGGIFAVGGRAGSGGNGDRVTVYNSGIITTEKAGSTAIFAQSVGGGGGNGGGAVGVGVGGASVAIGGAAGPGGDGGSVIINGTAVPTSELVFATIATQGDRAHAIQAQSVGGGGGNGGFAYSVGGGSIVSANVALGGSGGNGGKSSSVSVRENGSISTGGDMAIGIFAQSVGGGGGSGGGSVAASGAGAVNLSVAIGGIGGNGGAGSTVTVNTLGDITTAGSMSHAILAQSVGGGGGNGGYSGAGSVGGFSGALALGGAAGTGGAAAAVDVDSGANILTTGAGSVGILAQSIGGGGGNGGIAATIAAGGAGIGVALGGQAGAGSAGDEVSVKNSGTVTTLQDNSSAIFAQSVGGGGGNGGMSLSGAGGIGGAAVSLGGSGGAGSHGGAVTVSNSGALVTGYATDVDAVYGSNSYGIFAQSVGGGGGNGGMALSGALGISVEGIPGGAAAISIGGKGGGASNGGKVTVANTATVETFGLGAHAIFAQSVGGGGGAGGLAGSVAMTIGNGAAFGIAVGGSGGGGGNGDTVSVHNIGGLADIVTHSDGAGGIHAQSVGGGGGDGGFALAGSFGFSTETSVNVAVAIGGSGGSGGTGGAVVALNESSITTFGNNSNGIMAHSIGGGGGNGGMSVAGTLTFAETAGAVGVSVGGGGGSGNIANAVTVTNSGAISTVGMDSIGILAQSIGGSGGNGGLALTAQMTGANKESATVGVSVGGGGGNGNSGGIVTVLNGLDGNIFTLGANSHGIKAQSLGGGGGNGGLAAVAQLGIASGSEAQATKTLNIGVSVGGNGGTGSVGGLVHVTNDGIIEAMGDAATGIFAASIGGGGGDAGNAVTAIGMITDSTNNSSRALALNVAVGGKGGSGNLGGTVTVDNSGLIVTHGGNGYGIFAQSVGGGGGIGGRSNAITMMVADTCSLIVVCTAPDANKNNMTANITVGGDGGTGGHGGAVTVNNTGEIITFESASDGIYAQSIGGGGGNGANGVLGTEGILPVPLEFATTPVSSVKFYKNLGIGVGGDSGATGNGGLVSVNNSHNITTLGSNSNGITAQSVGGGGGIGGKAVIGLLGKVGVGGKGGAAGDGGDVVVSQLDNALIQTFGVASYGIFAQSVGGGGGVAGNVDRLFASSTGPVPALNVGIGLALGQGGGDGGDGGTVDVNVDGTIITHGDSAAAIFAHSIGGGGGLLGGLGNDLPVIDLLSWHIGSNGDEGSGGEVVINLEGQIYTAGNNATGIFAQSSGGKGTGGNVSVTVDGTIMTAALINAEDGTVDSSLRGVGSAAIIAHSAGEDGNGDITIQLTSVTGLIQGGRTADGEIGVGILFLDGKNNSLINHGTIASFDGTEAGFAIFADGSNKEALGMASLDAETLDAGLGTQQKGGNEAISNFGTIIGSFDLGEGSNSFINEADGIFKSGRIAYVGANNLMTNDGWMSPGGIDEVMTTEITGNLLQSETGVYGLDLDLALSGLDGTADPVGSADLYRATGAIEMAGLVDVKLHNVGKVLPGYHTVIIAQSDEAFTDLGVGLQTRPSAVSNFWLTDTAKDLVLNYAIDFSPLGLNRNEASLGHYINQFQTAGGSPALEPVIEALFYLPDLAAYANALDQLTPEPYAVNELAAYMGTLDFENRLMSCKVAAGLTRFSTEGECAWSSFNGRKTNFDGTFEHLAYNQSSIGISAGFQQSLGNLVWLGGGLSWDTLKADTEHAQTEGHLFQGGAVLKAQHGDSMFAAAMIGGYANFDVSRQISLTDGPYYDLENTQKMTFISGHLRASHTFANDNFYVRPSVDLGVTHAKMHGFEESGDSPVALITPSRDELYVTLQPAIEVGGEVEIGVKTVLRPFAKIGMFGVLSGKNNGITASFAGAPDGVEGFTVTGGLDPYMLDLSAGVDFIDAGGVTFRLTGDARLGKSTQSYRGSLKVSVPF